MEGDAPSAVGKCSLKERRKPKKVAKRGDAANRGALSMFGFKKEHGPSTVDTSIARASTAATTSNEDRTTALRRSRRQSTGIASKQLGKRRRFGNQASRRKTVPGKSDSSTAQHSILCVLSRCEGTACRALVPTLSVSPPRRMDFSSPLSASV
jgi:hypothetical protein